MKVEIVVVLCAGILPSWTMEFWAMVISGESLGTLTTPLATSSDVCITRISQIQ